LAVEQKGIKKKISKETQTEEEILEKDKQVPQEDPLAVKILRWLTENDNLSIKLSDDSRHWEVNGWQESNPLEIEVIYITAQKKAVVRYWCHWRDGRKTGKPNPIKHEDYLSFVKIIAREECIQHFGINFVRTADEQIVDVRIQTQKQGKKRYCLLQSKFISFSQSAKVDLGYIMCILELEPLLSQKLPLQKVEVCFKL